jgi:hypothetical protein
MIALYTSETPNGWKISITIEELGRDHDDFTVFESGAILRNFLV